MRVLKGTLQVPGDKSISHRGLIFSALSKGVCKIYGLSPAFDCTASADCLQQLGLSFERKLASGNGDRAPYLLVKSPGLAGLRKPDTALFAHNSGTSIRLLSGLVAGSAFSAEFDGDESLRKRPMARVLSRLSEMGANIQYMDKENYPPFRVEGGNLKGRRFELKEASAQVQTALLLAGLQADGKTEVLLPGAVRDHTERMFKHIGLPFQSQNKSHLQVELLESPLEPFALEVPGDISSAAFFMVAAACLPGSELLLINLSLNPGRDLVIQVLKELGAEIEIVSSGLKCQEPVGDVFVRCRRKLKGASVIDAERLASGIDEIPILALAAALSEASLTVQDANELRVKESDRLAAICQNLKSAGATLKELGDGFVIEGSGKLAGGSLWQSFDDHRMAMTGLIAALACSEPVQVDNDSCVSVSYPEFAADLKRVLV